MHNDSGCKAIAQRHPYRKVDPCCVAYRMRVAISNFQPKEGKRRVDRRGGGIELKDVGTKTHHNNALFRSLSKSIPLYLVSLENLGGDGDSPLREIEKWDRPHKEPKKTNTNENFGPSTLQLTSTHDTLSELALCKVEKSQTRQTSSSRAFPHCVRPIYLLLLYGKG